jgi:predicted dehydrogenase
MLAENYCYLDEVELVKRLADSGSFGEIYYGEGEYVHDCRDLFQDEEGTPTWRGNTGKGTGLGVYCTHSLGPLLYVLDDRVTQVAALANEASRIPAGRAGHFNFIMLMQTAKGATLRVRVDTVSRRPHVAAYYAVQGSRGCYESHRGLGDEPKVWFEADHEESHCFESAQWHPLASYEERHIPDRLGVREEARRGGHGATEYWMLKDFIESIQRQEPPAMDVHRGLDYTVPGLCAAESVGKGGAVIAVPDSRERFE